MTSDNQSRDMYGENYPATESANSHQFLVLLQAHEGECAAASASKPTTGYRLRLLNSMDQFPSIRKMETKLLLVRRWHGNNVDMGLFEQIGLGYIS